MGYKFVTGSIRRGDIYFEDDRTGAQTYIDFGQDTITLRPSGAAQLYVEDEKVGIGTTSPDHTLHVTSPGTCHVKIESEAGYEAALKLSQDGQSSAYVWMPGSTSDLRFYVNSADRMHIDNDGNIGIATTDPKVKLDVHHNPAALSNDTGGGEVVTFGTGTLTAGKIYYLNSSGVWTETDADAIATSNGLLGIALGSSPSSNGVLLRGFFDATTYLSNFISGLPVYLSTTAASMDTTQPSGTADIIRCVGYCTNTANVIYFNPESVYLELS